MAMLSVDLKSEKKTVVVVEDQNLFMRQLMPFLQDIEGRWKDFAIALEISDYVIDNIKADCCGSANNADCCREMFALWRRSTKEDKRTWRMIKKAARTLEMQSLIKWLEDNCVNGMMISYFVC